MLGNEGTPGWRCEGAVRVTVRDSQAPVLDVLWTDASRRRIRDAMRSSHDPQITIWYGEDLSPEDAVSRREDWREWLLESCGQPSAESRGPSGPLRNRVGTDVRADEGDKRRAANG